MNTQDDRVTITEAGIAATLIGALTGIVAYKVFTNQRARASFLEFAKEMQGHVIDYLHKSGILPETLKEKDRSRTIAKRLPIR